MNRNPLGFTIVELMIILLLLGIISAATIPSISSTLDQIRLDAAAREAVYAIKYAQSLSMKEGLVYGVEFIPSEEKFRCYKKTTGETIINPLDKKPYVLDFGKDRSFQGVDIKSANFGGFQVVEFNSLGGPSAEGSVALGHGNFQKSINVSGIIGKVTAN